MDKLGYKNVFIGTVEGEPEDTACDVVIGKVKDAGYKKVILRPLMVVAGDHSNNDMAGDDEDSWKSQFTAVCIMPSGHRHSQKSRPTSGVSKRTTRKVIVADGWMRHARYVGAPKNAAVTQPSIAAEIAILSAFFIVRPPRS
jgi:hypothetical protein